MTLNCSEKTKEIGDKQKLQDDIDKLVRWSDCVHATSVNVFKNRIDKYLVKAGYT